MGRDRFTDFERVDSIFKRALEIPPEARESWLQEACGQDTELLSRVRDLLELASEESGTLSAGSRPRAAWADNPAPAGTRFGPWRVLEQVGRGGMAFVYRAERADGAYQQQVAIKLLDRTRGSASLKQRFERERGLLARLEHPNIARLLDGGTTEDGRSYIVMEYVEGETIERWCDARRLSIDARLKLFLAVCDAVQFAHRRLIVHRDIKPGNILVTPEGIPKLLDFGIAKLLEADSNLGNLTRTGLADRVLTPQYASPEQVLGEPVSTATDVHALGLLLYELLSGHHARSIDSSRPTAIEKAVCETRLTAPSLVAATDIPARNDHRPLTAREIAAGRGMSKAGLKRRLTGDLDNIVLVALRREPERRYASAEHLAEDVRRHLNALPVKARPDGVAYRADRFVRRHAAGVATAVAVTVLATGTIGFYTDRLARERDSAERAAEQARIEAARAEQVAGFLTDLFEVSDPETSRGETVTARELLERGAERFERDLTGQPLLKAEMMNLVGSIYHQLGMYERSRLLLTRSLDLRRKHAGEDSLETAESDVHLGRLHLSTRNYAEAELAFRRALAIRERHLGPYSAAVAAVLLDLAMVAENMNRFEEAEDIIGRALAILEKSPVPTGSRGVDDALTALGVLQWNRGQQQDAESIFHRVLRLRQKLYPPKHLRIASASRRYGVALQARGAYEEAESLYQHALSIYENSLGLWHRDTALAVNSLASLYDDWGRTDDALPLARRFLEIAERAMGPRDNLTAIAMGNLATMLTRTGRLREAEALLRDAVELFRESPIEQNIAWAEMQLAATVLADGRPDEAVELLRQAIQRRVEMVGADEPGLALFWRKLGEAERASGRLNEAERALQRAENLQKRHLPEDHIELAKTQLEQASLAASTGDCAGAVELLDAAQPVLTSKLPADHQSRIAANDIGNRCSKAILNEH